jgi:DNA-binding PadR family transcriptional regulator
MHGYQLARALENRSRGPFQFKEGLLRGEWEGQCGTRRRKIYRPTAEGQQRLT